MQCSWLVLSYKENLLNIFFFLQWISLNANNIEACEVTGKEKKEFAFMQFHVAYRMAVLQLQAYNSLTNVWIEGFKVCFHSLVEEIFLCVCVSY